MVHTIRWKISIIAWWVWLKITPEVQFKRDMIEAVAGLRHKYPGAVHD